MSSTYGGTARSIIDKRFHISYKPKPKQKRKLRLRMYEDTCSFHLNTSTDVNVNVNVNVTSETAPFLVSDTLRSFEDNLNQSHMEEFSSCQQNHNQICLDDEVAGHIATVIPHQQEQMGVDTNNVHIMVSPMLQEVQGSNHLLSYDSSAWDSNLNEIQELVHHGDHRQQVQHPLDQQFQQIELQSGIQYSYDSSSLPDSTTHPYPTPDLLNLLQLPRCSGSLLNSSMTFSNPSQKTAGSYQNSLGFLGELQSTGMDNTTGSSVTYDPLFHLNLPPQPPIFRELFQSLPNGYSLPTSRHGSLFGGATHDQMDGNGGVFQDTDGRQFDNSVLQFSSGDMPCVGKGCKDGENTKHFATEKQRRQHLNDKYDILRSLIPCPSKIDRASVVGDAIGHIKELLSSVSELQMLVENKRYGRDRRKRSKTEGDIVGGEQEMEDMKPMVDSDHCYNRSLRSSWIQRKSKDTEVDVRIIDDEVSIKLVQRKKINCLLFVSKILDEFLLDLQHVAGGHIGDYWSFLFNTKINVGSSVYASAIASKMMEVMDIQYAAAISDPARNY